MAGNTPSTVAIHTTPLLFVVLTAFVIGQAHAGPGNCTGTRYVNACYHCNKAGGLPCQSQGQAKGARSADACCTACVAAGVCDIWTFTAGVCYMKAWTGKPTAPLNCSSVSGSVRTAPAPPPPVPPTPPAPLPPAPAGGYKNVLFIAVRCDKLV